MKNIVENQGIKTDKPLAMSYEALKAERDAQQKRADALAVENQELKSAMRPELIPDEVMDVFSDTAKYDHESCGPWNGSWIKNADEVIKAVFGAMPKPETPATDAALAAIHARFCELLDTYGKVEPERFNPEFADLYAKIANRIFSSVMDNPHVIDIDSMTEWLEISAVDARAYADMSIKFHAELREGK
ncbi:hypothetical protein I5M74_15145 [Serratia marcescens]|nr:hypothetical protein [Serratia marcescens]